MPKAFPAEFRRDEIAVARKGEASITQIARDFGISESCVARWLKIAYREAGLAPPVSGDRGGGAKHESAELRELGRRNKLLERENEILRRATAYSARDVLPKGSTRRRFGKRAASVSGQSGGSGAPVRADRTTSSMARAESAAPCSSSSSPAWPASARR